MTVDIIGRAVWGARYPNGCTAAPLSASECWLHHSVTAQLPPTATVEQECAQMRAIEQIGQDRFGCGISYTWLVFPSGRVYEGHSPGRQGTHTGGRNDIARAVCYPGNYDLAVPTGAQLRATADLLRHAHAQVWLDAPQLDGGHRDLKQTACPGQHAYALIDDINQLAAGPLIEEDDMAVTDAEKTQLLAGAASVQFGQEGVRSAGPLALVVAEIRQDVADLKARTGLDYDQLAKALLRNMGSA